MGMLRVWMWARMGVIVWMWARILMSMRNRGSQDPPLILNTFSNTRDGFQVARPAADVLKTHHSLSTRFRTLETVSINQHDLLLTRTTHFRRVFGHQGPL